MATSPRVLIGETTGQKAYQFAGVVGALQLSDGRIVVADGASGEVRYFSATGEHLRTVGRTGNGPGEFRRIDWVGARGDSVLVWDSFAARLTVFAPDASLAREVRVDGLGPFPKVIGMMGDGSLVVRPTGAMDSGASVEGEFTDSVTYLRIDAKNGRNHGSLGRFLVGEEFGTRRGGLYVSDHVVFGREGLLAVSPDGYYIGDTGAFELALYTPDGKRLRTVGRAQSPVRARAADIAAEVARRREQGDLTRMFPQMGPVQQAQFASLPHRSTLPAISRVVVDGEANVWMQEFSTEPDSAQTWSVFDPAGRWLGRVTTPAGLDVRQIGSGWVIGVQRDELGIERVAVHALRR